MGGLGFGVDAGLTELLIAVAINPVAARILAIAVALSVTFLLNRYFAFQAATFGTLLQQGARYFVISIGSIIVNFSGFMVLLTFVPTLRPVWCVAFGSALAMLFSYVGYLHFAFRKPSKPAV